MTAPICFLDTETTGVHPGRKVWEVAAIRREPDGTEIVLDAFVEVDLAESDPFGLRVGRFYDRHPLGRYLSGQALKLSEPGETGKYLTRDATALAVARLTHGAHLVGAVPNFDTEVLDPSLREEWLAPAWHYHLVDVENLAVGFLAGQGKVLPPPWKSDELYAALGLDPIPEDERHTALGDARFAMSIYDRVMSGVEL